MLGDDDPGAALAQLGEDGVAVEGRVGDQRAKRHTVDQGRHTDRVEATARQQDEAHQIAQRIGEGEDLGGRGPLGAADSLPLRPPLAPWAWRWTLTMVASTMAYSRSGSSEQASKSRRTTSALTQSR